MPEKSVLPLKLPKRVITIPAIVPNKVATVEDIKATFIVTHAASLIPWLCISSPYHFVEKPPQTVTNLDSLKLNRINKIIGIYKNENPITKAAILKLPNFFMRLPFLEIFDRT